MMKKLSAGRFGFHIRIHGSYITFGRIEGGSKVAFKYVERKYQSFSFKVKVKK